MSAYPKWVVAKAAELAPMALSIDHDRPMLAKVEDTIAAAILFGLERGAREMERAAGALEKRAGSTADKATTLRLLKVAQEFRATILDVRKLKIQGDA